MKLLSRALQFGEVAKVLGPEKKDGHRRVYETRVACLVLFAFWRNQPPDASAVIRTAEAQDSAFELGSDGKPCAYTTLAASLRPALGFMLTTDDLKSFLIMKSRGAGKSWVDVAQLDILMRSKGKTLDHFKAAGVVAAARPPTHAGDWLTCLPQCLPACFRTTRRS